MVAVVHFGLVASPLGLAKAVDYKRNDGEDAFCVVTSFFLLLLLLPW